LTATVVGSVGWDICSGGLWSAMEYMSSGVVDLLEEDIEIWERPPGM
jgi:hypothetical protein